MITKAVIPAAGLGTRFLPATKAQPKEMLPIVDTPTIQFVVEEAVSSGVDDILIITGRGKRAIEDHFDRSFELEFDLELKGKNDLLDKSRRISDLANIHYIRQKEQNGLGDAISYARQHIDKEPFVVLLGDSIVDSEVPCTRQLIDVYNEYQKPIIGIEEVPMEKVSRYGIIEGEQVDDSLFLVKSLIEKPDIDKAPSNLAVAGRYILTSNIFGFIEKTPPGKNGEIQLTDAIKLMLEEEKVYAYKFEGKRHDIGNMFDYLKTIVEYALKRSDVGEDFKEYLKEIVLNEK